MTTERTTGQAEDVTDARVSAAYRDLAGERTPASLNERVLREARAHAGSGYSWWMGWLRPAAWVATVGLCLAIVVELSNTPMTEIDRIDVPAALEPAALDDTVDAGRESRDDRSPSDALVTSDELRQQAPARKNEADADSAASPGVTTPSAPPQPAGQVDTMGQSSTAAEPKVTAENDILNITDAPILDEAEEMARMREGPRQEPAERASLRSFAALADGTGPAECDDDARAAPDSWIECILDIERQGGDAGDEREQFKATFPDTDLP